MFWSDRSKTWEAPRQKTTTETNTTEPSTKQTTTQKPPAKITTHPCPVCKKPLEEYAYIKEGQNKTMLRCSDSQSRVDKKHKDVAYFSTQKGWWSPKFGELQQEKTNTKK